MNYNLINNISISKCGLGIMRHSNNQQATQELVDYAMINGINYFEGCSFYLNWKCEERLAQALSKYPRESYVLCDKLPLSNIPQFIQQDNDWSLENFFNKQLQTMNTSYFDVYLIQAIDRKFFNYIEKYQVLEFLKKKKEEGYIKILGFSFHDNVDILKQTLQLYNWDIVQLQLNYYDWILGDAKQLYWEATNHNVPIAVMGPTKGGLLINNLPKENQEHMKRLHINPAYLCYSFLSTLSNVKIILSGAQEIFMLKDNLYYFNNEHNYPLMESDYQIILNNIDSYRKNNIINCTACNYCDTVCQRQIPIAEIFKTYNDYMLNKNSQSKEYLFNRFKSNTGSTNCINCGKCEIKCPQHLPIRKIFHEKIFPMRL